MSRKKTLNDSDIIIHAVEGGSDLSDNVRGELENDVNLEVTHQ
jgi:hypothetical protein